MRRGLDIVMGCVAGGCLLACLAISTGLVWSIARRGWGALSFSFFTEQIALVGASGGIFWNLVGTTVLLSTAFLACAPLAVSLALMERVWLRSESMKKALRLGLYTANGLPSIVFGLFGFLVFVQWCGWGKSWLAGGLVLAMSMLPTVTLVVLERMAAIPQRYIAAATGLGLSQSRVAWAVLLKQSWGGLISGSLLGLARAAGETAPIMFTATIFAGVTFPKGVVENPVLTLPYHIFILAQDSFAAGVETKMWGTALVLLGLVFSMSVAALPSRLYLHEESDV
ncbi:MAG: ABC transporter permease subunit [Chthoniobacteraceae bacterium]|jgi:phosphate transport system permease protein|nr:ABC transporter permease subunit [Chthoniobacteraceae bacterium]